MRVLCCVAAKADDKLQAQQLGLFRLSAGPCADFATDVEVRSKFNIACLAMTCYRLGLHLTTRDNGCCGGLCWSSRVRQAEGLQDSIRWV